MGDGKEGEMEKSDLKRFLVLCTVFNVILLVVWFLAAACAGEAVYKLHTLWFPMSKETFSAIHYAGMAFYKILVIFFNVIPLVALGVVSRKAG